MADSRGVGAAVAVVDRCPGIVGRGDTLETAGWKSGQRRPNGGRDVKEIERAGAIDWGGLKYNVNFLN